jgi:hypothetical protein
MMLMDGFDVTFPRIPLTGNERSLADLTKPDERSTGYGFNVEALQAPYLELEKRLPERTPKPLRDRIDVSRQLAVYAFFCYEFHAVSMFWSVSCTEMALKLKFRELHPGPIKLVRKAKDGTVESSETNLTMLEKRLREKWRIPGMKDFDYSFRAFLTWAFRSNLLPEDLPIPLQEIVHGFNNRFALEIFFDRAVKEGLIGPNPTLGDLQNCWNSLTEKQREHYRYKSAGVLIEELPRFRNDLAHPESWNLVAVPRSPLGTFELLIDIVARLWPDAEQTTPQERNAHRS